MGNVSARLPLVGAAASTIVGGHTFFTPSLLTYNTFFSNLNSVNCYIGSHTSHRRETFGTNLNRCLNALASSLYFLFCQSRAESYRPHPAILRSKLAEFTMQKHEK